MSPSEGDAVWSLVLFDLPVSTKEERRQATAFRNLLLDMGYSRVQFSVYVRYTPTAGAAARALAWLRAAVPPGGQIRVLHVTDHQWATATRFENGEERDAPEQPPMLEIF